VLIGRPIRKSAPLALATLAFFGWLSFGCIHKLHENRAQCVIICPASLQSQADALNSFHASEGIRSEVITTETISANYTAAGDPPFAGYKNSGFPGWEDIKHYNYTLAKQIVAYLKDNNAHPNLDYVAILGDALLVPPSYYYSLKGGPADDNWVPTDFFYGSPDYDFVPNFKIGRLPVSDTSEAAALVNKIVNWYATASWSWFKKVYFVGGNGTSTTSSGSPSYWGEFVPVTLINENVFSGMEIHKCFHTDGNFTKSCLEPALSTAEAGLLYLHGHGYGDSAKLDSTSLYASDIMAYAPNSRVPVVVGVGCYNGAFDLDLVSTTYSTSFGEAVLKSPAGGIAYFGGSRYINGSDYHRYEQGNFVLIKGWYLGGLQLDILRSYHNLRDTLGDLNSDAINAYIADNNMALDVLHQEQLFMNVLLGDPALKIPVQQPLPEHDKASYVAVNPPQYDANNIPFYNTAPVTITATTTSPTVRWKLVNVTMDTTLDYTPPTSNFTYTSNYSNPGLYLIRVASEAAVPNPDYGKENWFYFSIGEPPRLIFVSDISMAIQTDTRKGTKKAIATVTVKNNAGSFVPGVTVSGHWSGLTTNTSSGKTNRNGQVAMSSDSVSTNASGTFSFCVDDAIRSGWFFDLGASAKLRDQIAMSPEATK
jgi:hypothetical protein